MKTLVAAVAVVLSLAGSVAASELRTGTGAEPLDKLDRARLLIFDRNWPKAVAELKRVAEDRKEPLRDEALFWLAHSLFQMGDPAEALRVIERLERDHPRSRWVLPAASLRAQIATRTWRPEILWDIVVRPAPAPPAQPASPSRVSVAPRGERPRNPRLAPRPPAPPAAPEAPLPPALTFIDVKIQALSGLLVREPERAVPVLREIVVEAMETPQARRALFVLGMSPHEEAREAIVHFAQTGPDQLRVVAVEQLGRWRTLTARNVLTSVYESGSERVKLEVLRSLGEARADRELIRLARSEADEGLREYAVAQLRLIDTQAARAYLRTVK